MDFWGSLFLATMLVYMAETIGGALFVYPAFWLGVPVRSWTARLNRPLEELNRLTTAHGSFRKSGDTHWLFRPPIGLMWAPYYLGVAVRQGDELRITIRLSWALPLVVVIAAVGLTIQEGRLTLDALPAVLFVVAHHIFGWFRGERAAQDFLLEAQA